MGLVSTIYGREPARRQVGDYVEGERGLKWTVRGKRRETNPDRLPGPVTHYRVVNGVWIEVPQSRFDDPDAA